MLRTGTPNRVLYRMLAANRQSSRQNITYQEATSTLRPFFFAVHPDFFGQLPEYRMQNEQSLKILNSRLVSISSNKGIHFAAHDQKTYLTFFVRKTALTASAAGLGKKEPSVTPVQISLQHVNLRELVLHILQSSNLPLTDLLTLINKPKPHPKSKSRLWIDCKEDESGTRRPSKPTLSSWLLDNLPRAIESYFASQPVRADVAVLELYLLKKYRLCEIVWNSEWTPSSHATCLRALRNILQQDRAQHVLRSLVGKRIVFAQQTGNSVFNDILLSVSDVPEAWLSAISEYHIESSPDYVARGYSLSSLERGVSMLLYGAQVKRHRNIHGATPMKSYYRQVRSLFQTLLRYTKDEMPQYPKHLFSNLSVCVEDVGGSLTYAEDFGLLLIPAGTPGFLVIDYLWRHYSSKETSTNRHLSQNDRYLSLCDKLKKEWGLVDIKRDMNVSLQQGLHCLEALSLHGPKILPRVDALCGLELCVARYFAVSSSGIIYFPWDADMI